MMALKWPGESFEIGHSIMVTRKGDSFLCEELFDDVQRLYQAIDAYFP